MTAFLHRILGNQIFMHSEKLLLRSRAKEQRKKFYNSFSETELLKLQQCISWRVLDFFKFKPSDIIAGYWPKSDEVDPRPLLENLSQQKHEIVLPIVNKGNNVLLFRRWTPHSPLKIGLYKNLEPFENQPTFVPDVLFIPLLNFNKQGHRLGYGGGYYDQTLAALKKIKTITTIGLAYDIQHVNQFPIEPHDEALQWVVTEKKIYNFSEVI